MKSYLIPVHGWVAVHSLDSSQNKAHDKEREIRNNKCIAVFCVVYIYNGKGDDLGLINLRFKSRLSFRFQKLEQIIHKVIIHFIYLFILSLL